MKKGIIVVVLITLSLILFRPPKIKAAEIKINSWGQKVNYEIYWLDDRGTETLQSDWITGDFTNFCPNGIVCGLTTNWLYLKLGTSLSSANTYTINFDEWITTRKTEDFYNNNLKFNLIASNTGEYNGSSSSFIRNLACQAGLQEGTTSKVSFSCSFTPTQSINYLYLKITYNNKNIPFTSFGVNKPKIIYDNSTTDAINNQTTIIQNQTNAIINAITGEHEYDNTPSEKLEGKEEIDNLKNKEEELLGNLDFSAADNLEITINSEAARFIWEIVEALRSINGKIVLLITSILGLGIIKMILNR